MENIFFFALGMCVSLMTIVISFSFGSEKLIAKFKGKKLPINWRLIQGSLFILIGAVTALYH